MQERWLKTEGLLVTSGSGGGVDAPAGHTPPSVIDSAASPLCLARAFCSAAALKCIDFRQPFRLLVDLIS